MPRLASLSLAIALTPALVLWLALGCTVPSAPAPAPAQPPLAPPAAAASQGHPPPVASLATTVPEPPLRVRFAYAALTTAMTPYWIADESGFFREEGLVVESTYVSAGPVAI